MMTQRTTALGSKDKDKEEKDPRYSVVWSYSGYLKCDNKQNSRIVKLLTQKLIWEQTGPAIPYLVVYRL